MNRVMSLIMRPQLHLASVGLRALVAAVAVVLAWRGYWPAGLAVVLVAELWPLRRRSLNVLVERSVVLVIGVAAVLVVAMLPKLAAQLVVGLMYVGWRARLAAMPAARPVSFVGLLAVQAVWLEAMFLLPAVWHAPRPLVLVLVWLGCYATVYQALAARRERSAGTLAAAWALVATEAAWVFLVWQVSYVTAGSYLIVPHATVVLVALAYCFGNIYVAQRSGKLDRTRLTEYLLIGLVLIWLVVAGTPWRGTL
jgi:hypothetical protein